MSVGIKGELFALCGHCKPFLKSKRFFIIVFNLFFKVKIYVTNLSFVSFNLRRSVRIMIISIRKLF